MPSPSLGPVLASFEAALDASLEESCLWRAPRHLVLALILDRVRDLELGGPDPEVNPPSPRKAESLIDRLPALVPFLARCPAKRQTGAPVSLPQVGGLIEVVEVLTWVHAAELYPDLWRGWRTVTTRDEPSDQEANLSEPSSPTPADGGSGDVTTASQTGIRSGADAGAQAGAAVRRFVAQVASEAAGAYEVRDIILGRLSAPWGTLDSALDEDLASALDVPGIPAAPAAPLLALRALRSLHLRELDLVDDAAMQRIAGVGNAEFDSFRDACVALGSTLAGAASHCLRQVSAGATATHQSPDSTDAEQWLRDAQTWALPVVAAADLTTWLAGLSDLEQQQTERLIGAFSEPHTGSGWPGKDGQPVDGFFPPFWRIAKDGEPFFVVSPWHLRSTVMRHSLLSRYARLDPNSFHNFISSALEPELLRITTAIWEELDDVVVVTNRNWFADNQRGEFDALVYQSRTNTVLHIQAKGSLGAVSARMIERMEATVDKGVSQLEAVRNLPASDRDLVLSRALGVEVESPALFDVLLTSGGVGSESSWERLGSVVPVNPVLLQAAIRAASHDQTADLGVVVAHAVGLLDELVRQTDPTWEEQTAFLGLGSDAGSMEVTFPSLRLDQRAISAFRAAAWPTVLAR